MGDPCTSMRDLTVHVLTSTSARGRLSPLLLGGCQRDNFGAIHVRTVGLLDHCRSSGFVRTLHRNLGSACRVMTHRDTVCTKFMNSSSLLPTVIRTLIRRGRHLHMRVDTGGTLDLCPGRGMRGAVRSFCTGISHLGRGRRGGQLLEDLREVFMRRTGIRRALVSMTTPRTGHVDTVHGIHGCAFRFRISSCLGMVHSTNGPRRMHMMVTRTLN